MKILVLGFQRGGTTLLRRLIDAHPDVICMLHDRRLLKFRSKERIYNFMKKCKECPLQFDRDKTTWGEKVPFFTGKVSEVTGYRDKWLKTFGGQARIVFITRHPIDVVISHKKLGWSTPSKVISAYANLMPKVTKEMAEHPKCIVVSFESLVTKPTQVLAKVFKFCKINSSKDIVQQVASSGKRELRYFDKIEPSRAFAWKKQQDSKIVTSIINLAPNYSEIRQYETK